MTLESRIANLETRHGSRDDSGPFAVWLGRWLAGGVLADAHWRMQA